MSLGIKLSQHPDKCADRKREKEEMMVTADLVGKMLLLYLRKQCFECVVVVFFVRARDDD